MPAATDKIKTIQGILGVTADGKFGPRSRAALSLLVIQTDSAAVTAHSKAFTDFFPFLMEWEGEAFENDPDDPGGATKYGIDQRSHPEVNIRALTKDQAEEIYWREWLAAGCGGMPSPFAEVYFNCAVNMGLSRAQEFTAAAGQDPRKFLQLQEAKYRSLGASSTRQMFLKGWLNRTAALRKRFAV